MWGCEQGPVPSEIRPGAKLLVLGEAPGKADVTRGVSFSTSSKNSWGRISAGDLLNEGLEEGGSSRSEISAANVIQCRPPNDDLKRLLAIFKREGKTSPIEHCLPRLKRELEAAAPNTVLGLGTTALEATARITGTPFGSQRGTTSGGPRLTVVSKQHGHPLVLPDLTVCASFHPAAALRSKAFIPLVKQSIARAVDIADRRGKPRWKWPDAVIMPSFEEVLEALHWLQTQKSVTFDLEANGISRSAQITCVGLGVLQPNREVWEITVPLRRRSSGKSFWSPEQDERIRRELRKLFDNEEIELVGQNIINFDLPFLRREGLLTKKRRKNSRDIMINHHNTKWSEHRHGLGFIASCLYDVEFWKEDADSSVFFNINDEDEHVYNAKDVVVTCLAGEDLKAHMRAAGMEYTNQVDHKIAHIAQEMSDLGLMYDMDERFRIFLALREKKIRYLAEFRAFAKKEKINPNSVPQLRDWLYDELGLEPPFTTQGREFDPDENEDNEASTGEAAIIQLVKDGVEPRIEKALKALLRYRSAQKLISTYVQLEELDRDKYREASKDGRQMYDLGGLIVAETKGSFAEIEDAHGYGLGLIVVVHPRFKVHVVPSGRFAASEPNVLAWPTAMRKMICAPKGYLLVGADMEQIEARLFAVVSKDEKTIQMIKTGVDIHLFTWGIFQVEELTEGTALAKYAEMKAVWDAYKVATGKKEPILNGGRDISKTIRYAVSYGSEEPGLWQQFSTARDENFNLKFDGVKRKQVTDWFNRWHEFYPSTRRYFTELEDLYRRDGHISSLLHGRKRWLLGGWSQTEAANFPMQSSAADFMNDALIAVDEEIPHRGWGPMSGIVLQIHDDITAQVPEERAEEARGILRRRMTGEIHGMPLPVEVKKAAKYWSELK